MIKASLRGLLQRKLRLSLALIAIVLSVGFLAGSLVLSDTLNARFGSLFSTINANVAVVVQPKDPQAVDPVRLTDDQLRTLSEVDGVRAVSPDVSAQGVIPFRSDDGEPVSADAMLGFGVDGKDDPLGLVELREGSWPQAADEVTVTAYTAELARVKRGDSLKVYVPVLNEPRTFKVVGVAGYSGGRDSLAGESVVMFQQAYAQETFYGATGRYAGASFAADEGVSDTVLKQRIAEKLPSGFKALTGEESSEEQSAQIGVVFDFIKYILIGFAVLAAVVGVFLIFNTFNIIVAQRTRELALLRALGASWGQVAGSVLLEALVVSVLGATLGLAIGAGLGAWVEHMLIGEFELPSAGIIVKPITVVLAYALGVLVTLIAAFVPAVRASSVPPVAAMRDVVRPDKSLVALSVVGAVLAVPGLALVLTGALADMGGTAFLVLLAGAVLLFVGTLLLSPLLARPLVRGLGALIGRGSAGKLGVRNAVRNPRRTAVTAAAIIIGVTVIGTAATVVQSFKTSLEDIMGDSIGVEVMIQASVTAAPDGRQGFNPKALDQVRAIPGVKEAAAWHFDALNVSVANQPSAFGIFATDVGQASRMFPMDAVDGSIRTLAAQELVVDDNTAETLKLKAGDRTPVVIGGVTRDYTVVGVYKTTPIILGILVGLPAVEDFPGPLAFQGFVSLNEGVDAAPVVAQIEKIMKDYPGVQVGDRQSYVEQATASYDLLLTAVEWLLIVALVIAVLGILNTLLLSIVERTRELGLVRAVGLSRGGLVWMVTVESVLITVFGVALGLALGVGLGAAFTKALITIEFASVIAIPWLDLLQYLAIAVVAGIAAAVLPARIAARLNVLEAISYE
ncbi:FtsX-like permease family protein [Catellatospora bangladeshensis]|uniref:Membrane protein n=1 Tax=Catellatospora bangladeshensis TaxID=310355 RepID=A0A8J3JQU4_9ACTN|nr:ABC transporter permease [Catellatospora bangladeshensis]GIF85261.1 membrane protein [Catellatospora bangladeshensis]